MYIMYNKEIFKNFIKEDLESIAEELWVDIKTVAKIYQQGFLRGVKEEAQKDEYEFNIPNIKEVLCETIKSK